MHIIKSGGPVMFIPPIEETKYVQRFLVQNVLRFNPSVRGAYADRCFFDLRDSDSIVLPALWAKKAHIDGGDVVEQESFRGKDNREYVRVHVKPVMRHEHLIKEIIEAEKDMDELSFMAVKGIPATYGNNEYATYICGGTFYSTFPAHNVLTPMSDVSVVRITTKRTLMYPIIPRLAQARVDDWVMRDGVWELKYMKHLDPEWEAAAACNQFKY